MTTPPLAGESALEPRGDAVVSEDQAGSPQPESGPAQAVWQAPTHDFSHQRTATYFASSSVKTEPRGQGLLRTARWCMDGSTILTTSEDRNIRLYFTPASPASSGPTSELVPYHTLPQAAPILSSLWYPTASPSTPEGFCFAAAIRDAPVRLIDAMTGQIRATYPIVDHRERFVAPYSMAWNPSATKLYCGHENAIEILDISSPGYDTSERIKMTLTRGDKGGQKGIISALAFSTDYSGLYAAGSFGGSVSLYSEDESSAIGHLEGVEGGGVTQLAFHPLSPNRLFVASRRSAKLQVFDLRNPSEPFHSFPRAASTNQRMAFDLDPWGRWIAIGDERGKVAIWDVGGAGQWGERFWESQVADKHVAISSVQFHPLKPLLLVSSGSRQLGPDLSDSESDSDSEHEPENGEEEDLGAPESAEGIGSAESKKQPALRGLGILSFAPQLASAAA